MQHAKPLVAYVVLSHRMPAQVTRLVRRLIDGSDSAHVFVHHDRASAPLDHALWGDRVHAVTPARHVAWGDFSLVQATEDAMRQARDRVDPDWVVLLSGQDYPLRPIRDIEEELGETDLDVLADIWPFAAPPWSNAEEVSRYLYRYARRASGDRASATVARWLTGGYADKEGRRTRPGDPWRAGQQFVTRRVGDERLIGWRPWRPLLSDDYRCYLGAQWLTLSRVALAAVLDGEAVRRARRHFARTIVPDEAYFHTVVGNALPAERFGPSRRFVVWRGGPHPEVLTSDDLPALLGSTDHFGRKFDMGTHPAVLDELDRASRQHDA